jgi:hypothetical protein
MCTSAETLIRIPHVLYLMRLPEQDVASLVFCGGVGHCLLRLILAEEQNRSGDV